MNKKKALIGVLAGVATVALGVTVLFGVLAINRAGQFEQTIDEECAPLVTIAFRGSGEGNLSKGVTSNAGKPFQYGDTNMVTNGWEGITLTNLIDELSQTEYKGFKADTIPVVSVGPAGTDQPFGYDAILAALEASSAGSALTYEGSKLFYSASRGAEAATHLIQSYLQQSAGCPVLPKFVVVGYSQGAMAARHTAELNSESVLGAVMIGDPYQKPKAEGVRDAGATGTGIVRWKTEGEQRKRLDSYYGTLPFTSSICHGGDPICEFTPVEGLWKLASGTYGDHMDYYTDAYENEAPQDAEEIARIAYEQQQLAKKAFEAGQSVSWDEANDAANGDTKLRTTSVSFAGTPTLFSALSPAIAGQRVTFDFDLDGDGVYETTGSNGTVWATFDEEGPHTVSVRITNLDTGDIVDRTTTVEVGPVGGGDVTLTTPEEVVQTAVEPPPTSPPTSPPATPPSQQPVYYPQPVPAPAPTPLPPVTPPAPPAPPVIPDPQPDPDPDPDPVGPILVWSGPAIPGEALTLTGTGFTPGGFISGFNEEPFMGGEAMPDESGTFSMPMWVPGEAEPGEYEFVVTQGEHSYRIAFTVLVADEGGEGTGGEGEGEGEGGEGASGEGTD